MARRRFGYRRDAGIGVRIDPRLELYRRVGVVSLAGAAVPADAPIGTVVGTFNVAGVTIVGSTPFAVDGLNLVVDDTLTAGDFVLTVDAPAVGQQTFVIDVYAFVALVPVPPTIYDTDQPATLVGYLSVSDATIVGESSFVIVGFELLTGPDYIEPGTVTFDVSAPGYDTTTLSVVVVDNNAVLWNGEHTTWNGQPTTWNAAP